MKASDLPPGRAKLMVRALVNALDEQDRQIEKFGVQSHPDGTGDLYRALANILRDTCDKATQDGGLTWNLILAEEVYEALAESDPAALRAELVQVAAVALSWINDIDSRGEQ